MAAETIKKIFVWRGGTGDPDNPSKDDVYWNKNTNWFVRTPIGLAIDDVGDNILDIVTNVSSNREFYYTEATRVPGGGDDVIFTFLPDDPAVGLSGGPFPKHQCEFGGFNRMNGTNEWHNATGTGGDLSGNLKSLIIDRSYFYQIYGASADQEMKNQFGKSAPFYWDGPLWSGLELKTDFCSINNYGHMCIINGLEAKEVHDNGYAPLVISGGTANVFISNYDFDKKTENENNSEEGAGDYLFKAIKLNLINLYQDKSNKIIRGTITVSQQNETLDSLILSPNIIHSTSLIRQYVLNDVNYISIEPTNVTDGVINEVLINQMNQIQKFTLKNTNRYYTDIESSKENPTVKINAKCSIDEFISENGTIILAGNFAGDTDIQINSGLLYNGKIDLTGQINTYGDDTFPLNYIIGSSDLTGASGDRAGLFVLSNNYEVVFGNSSVIKTFSGKLEDSPIDAVITSSNQEIADIFQGNNGTIDL
jgi:hypothetical protein